jgi:hypothetical protein
MWNISRHMQIVDTLPIVREGVWMYEESVPVAVRVLQSSETWGSGDHEDEEPVRENQQVQCYFLAYEMAAAPGNFCNLVPNLPTLEAAMAYAEQRMPGIQWQGTEPR